MRIGNLLVATPKVLGDFNFHRSVILLTERKITGSIGFILNKKLDYTLDEVMDGIQSKFSLYFGGPVEQDNLFYIHSLGDQIPNSIPITNSLYWNGDFNIVNTLIDSGKLNKNNIRFFLGYSGWDPGQLESEFENRSWELFDKISPLELINSQIKNMWSYCMSSLGGDYLIWSNTPENPYLN